jgi:hypothetical protein
VSKGYGHGWLGIGYLCSIMLVYVKGCVEDHAIVYWVQQLAHVTPSAAAALLT